MYIPESRGLFNVLRIYREQTVSLKSLTDREGKHTAPGIDVIFPEYYQEAPVASPLLINFPAIGAGLLLVPDNGAVRMTSA